jgi:hypothetical protein
LAAFERPARAYVDPGSGFVFLRIAGFHVRRRRLLYAPSPEADPSCDAPIISNSFAGCRARTESQISNHSRRLESEANALNLADAHYRTAVLQRVAGCIVTIVTSWYSIFKEEFTSEN